MYYNRLVTALMMMLTFVGVSSRISADDCVPLLETESYPQVIVVTPSLLLVNNPNVPPITSEIYVETTDVQEAKVSDSGEWIAYLRFFDVNNQQIWITPVEEQEHQMVVDFDIIPPLDPQDRARPEQILQWEWLPQRDILAYTLLTESTTPLDAREHSIAINGSFAASPDGQHLALQTRDALYWVSLDDIDNPQRITDSETYQSIGAGLVHPKPYWLPDSSAFIQVLPISADITGNQAAIWKYALDEEPELIGTVNTNYFNIRVSPTVDQLAYWTRSDDGLTTISIADIDGRNAEVALSEMDIWFDSWTPDGQYFTYRQMSSSSTINTYLQSICDTE